jgi:hypothetical protein
MGGSSAEGSLYSFSSGTQTSRRYKGEQGDSYSNTLHSCYLVFFLPAHLADMARREVRHNGCAPFIYWHKSDLTPFVSSEDGHNGMAIDASGNLVPQPTGAVPVLRLVDEHTGSPKESGFRLKLKPEIGDGPLELQYTPGRNGTYNIRHHFGHPIAELFAETSALDRKIREMGFPVVIAEDTGHLAAIPIFKRSSRLGLSSSPVFQRRPQQG